MVEDHGHGRCGTNGRESIRVVQSRSYLRGNGIEFVPKGGITEERLESNHRTVPTLSRYSK